MAAAEYGFSKPPPMYECWQELCINAFNDYVNRWDTTTCGGGLKWQFYPANAGFHYKNAVSNGAFFQLSARLLRMTGNQTYLDWANKVYDWSIEIGLVDNLYNVFDGADDTINCTVSNPIPQISLHYRKVVKSESQSWPCERPQTAYRSDTPDI